MLASNPEVVAGSSHSPSRGGWVYPYLWFAPALVLLLAVTLYPTALGGRFVWRRRHRQLHH